MKHAKEAMDRLMDFCSLPDRVTPEVFIAGVVALMAQYPEEVMDRASDPVAGIPSRWKVVEIANVRAFCDELYAPIARDLRRRQIEEERGRLLPPPRRARTPEEQAAIDAQVAAVRRHFGIPNGKLGSQDDAAFEQMKE